MILPAARFPPGCAVMPQCPSPLRFCLFALVAWGRTLSAAEPPLREMAGDEFFERQVRPLLTQHCFACHGKDQKKGGLSLSSREALLAGGESGTVVKLEQPAESLLIEAVEHRGGMQMPPNGKLAESEIAVLRRWVELGIPWPTTAKDSGGIRTSGSLTAEDREFWSFRPVVDAPLPAVKNTAWPRRSLDPFILAALEARQLHPAPETDRRTYLRRVSFSLTGLPPSFEAVTAFINDPAADAYEKLVDRLLDSPQYGERWARHWLDIARYGEDQAHTFQARMYPQGYRYRDWIVTAFNRDMPYDQFITEQIAGDLLPAASNEERVARLPALGFFALGPVYYKDAGCAGKAEADEIDDRIDTLCRGFLGLTVSCARCHDHKFDPIPTQDYYALAGVFASTQYREAPLVSDDVARQYDDRAAVVKAREKDLTDAQAAEAVMLSESFAPQTADYIVAAWQLQQRRKHDGKVKTSEVMGADSGLHRPVIDRWVQFLTPDNLAQKSLFAGLKEAFTAPVTQRNWSLESPVSAVIEPAARTLEQQLVEALAVSRKQDEEYERTLAAATEVEKKNVTKPKLDSIHAELIKTLVTDKNAPFVLPKDQADKLLPESSRAVLAEVQKDVDHLKKELGPKYPIAHSLTDQKPTNLKVNLRGNHKELGEEVPRRFLTILSPGDAAPFQDGSGRLELARAIANPNNPLTARVLVNRVWQQHFGRGLVGTASNFGLLGERPTHPELLDHLAAKFVASGWSLKQLHREILLSATYRMASDLVPTVGDADPRVIDPDNRLLWRQNRRRLDFEAWRDAALAVGGNLDATLGGPSQNLNDAGHRRRTLYSTISRHDLNGTLRLFDFPDPNLTSERRVSTTVPMQQLYLLNSGFVVNQARELAKRTVGDGKLEDRPRIEQTYQMLYQRPPTENELRIGQSFLQATLPKEISASDVKLTAWEQYTQALLGTNEFAFVD